MILDFAEVRSSPHPPFDQFFHTRLWKITHFIAVIMIDVAVTMEIEGAWDGAKRTILDFKSFTDHVHGAWFPLLGNVAWYSESFFCRWSAMDFARFLPFFLQLFKFFGVSFHDDNISTFAMCSSWRAPFSFSLASVDYDSSAQVTTSSVWVWFARDVNRVNVETPSYFTNCGQTVK